MQTDTSSVRERIESVRAMIHELDAQDCFEGIGKTLACQVDEQLAALAEELDEDDGKDDVEEDDGETPLFI